MAGHVFYLLLIAGLCVWLGWQLRSLLADREIGDAFRQGYRQSRDDTEHLRTKPLPLAIPYLIARSHKLSTRRLT